MKRSELEQIKKVAIESQVIAFPTETVMGLGVIFDDEKAYRLLNQVKCRPEDKPYTLMLADPSDISKYAIVDERAEKIIKAFMPGSVTLLLKSKDNVPDYVTHNTGVIGVRVPNMDDVIEMISFIGKPLLVPSANKSGEKPCLTYHEVEKVFGNELGYIVKKDSLGAKPSTIIDLTHEDVKILREGPISLRDIERIL